MMDNLCSQLLPDNLVVCCVNTYQHCSAFSQHNLYAKIVKRLDRRIASIKWRYPSYQEEEEAHPKSKNQLSFPIRDNQST